MRALENMFDEPAEQYLTFYDKSGILAGGLWILFQQKSDTVLKIFPDRIFGDMILAFDRKSIRCNTFEELATRNPDPEYIVGFAIVTREEPKDYGKYITDYFIRIKRDMPLDMYKDQVYSYILGKLSCCDLRVVAGATMKESGLKAI